MVGAPPKTGGAPNSAQNPRRLRVAGLDLGTNTCLCLIAEIEVADSETGARKISSMNVIRDEVRVVRLGQGVNATKLLHPEALARAEEAFKEFSRYIDEAKCDRVLACATSATRDSTNRHLLIELGVKYGIPIETISGEKEAELTFAGSIEPSWQGLTAIIDVGGGSTEIIFGNQNGILARASADVGAVRVTEECVTGHPVATHEIDAMIKRVREALAEAKHKISESLAAGRKNHSGAGPDFQNAPGAFDEAAKSIAQVIGVAGTPTTLAAVDLGHAFETDRVHGHRFTRARLEEWTTKLAKMTVEERQQLAGMEPKRADVIVAGAICVTEAMRVLGREDLKVSVRGLRYGVAQMCALR